MTHTTEKTQNMTDMIWSAFLAVAFAAVMLVPEMALAAGATETPIGDVVCAIIGWLTGGTGRAIATLAIIIIGVGALMGKVSWGMAIIVAVGIAIVFGAPELFDLLADPATGTGGACG